MDPEGVKPREYDVYFDRTEAKHAVQKVSDKGGDEKHCYNIKRPVIDEDGSLILDANGKKQFVTLATHEVEDGTFNLIPGLKTDYSTLCIGHIPEEQDPFSCFMLFPKGPGSNVDGSNTIMQPGIYDLSINPGKKYPGVPLISRENPQEGEDPLYKWQARLFHAGNNCAETSGCGLPGSSYKENELVPKISSDEHKVYDTWVYGSKAALDDLQKRLKSKGLDASGSYELKMRLLEFIPDDNIPDHDDVEVAMASAHETKDNE